MKEIIGDHSIVQKVNVKNLKDSINWYVTKLGFRLNPKYATPTWAQLITDIPNVEIGLNQGTPTGTGQGVFTFVVQDIVKAREALIKKGVSVGAIEHYADGVLFAPFHDPDNNSMGLRQNVSKGI